MGNDNRYMIALNKAMASCSRREHCSQDIRNRLLMWGVSNSDADKIIRTLVKDNFINDSRFALAFVKDRFKYNKWGRVKIAAHLKMKGIASDIINPALNSIDNDEYISLLKDILKVRRKSVKAKNQYDLRAKLLRYGQSKGFEGSILYDILNETVE